MTSTSAPYVLIALGHISKEFKVIANQNQRIKAPLHQKEAVFFRSKSTFGTKSGLFWHSNLKNQDQTFMTSCLDPSEL